MESDGTRRGITRRDVIKRGAVLGGIVWAAPVVDTLMTSKAYATSAVNYCCYCYDTAGLDPLTNCGTTANPSDANLTDAGLADGHPPSAQACACFCNGFGYDSFQWSGPSPNSYALNTGTPANHQGPKCGCFQGSTGPIIAVTGPALCVG